ncbi:MAG TPA: MBL fold metallo-hydrolase [Anaerolineales bacterium]|nr:MBL fold metallo-hydrolase [Anaerolineales bacterium]
MRELVKGVFLQDEYPGVRLGAVVVDGSALLIDSPLRIEDGRDWLAAIGVQPKYMVLLDDHPDRVYGARGLDLPLVAHREAREAIAAWPDTLRAGGLLQGAEVDRLKRVSGLARAVPHIGFEDVLRLYVGESVLEVHHRPGPRPGSSWVVVPWARVVFVGDAIWQREPPYLGEADLEAWLEALAALRSSAFARYKIVSARDGVVPRPAIAKMASFLRKVAHRMERLQDQGEDPSAAGDLAPQLARGFRIPASRREQALIRLKAGLTRLFEEQYA